MAGNNSNSGKETRKENVYIILIGWSRVLYKVFRYKKDAIRIMKALNMKLCEDKWIHNSLKTTSDINDAIVESDFYIIRKEVVE